MTLAPANKQIVNPQAHCHCCAGVILKHISELKIACQEEFERTPLEIVLSSEDVRICKEITNKL
jgi:hypothetical protein